MDRPKTLDYHEIANHHQKQRFSHHFVFVWRQRELVFEIDVKAFKLPKSVAADINKSTTEKKTKPNKKGEITITLTDYKVNAGLSDAIFTKKK